MMMRWCQKCVLPSTRPELTIGPDGVCSGCKAHEYEDNRINWKQRRTEWRKLVDSIKSTSTIGGYEAVLGVSGGKDSFNQARICLDSGLKVLGVTWRPHCRTPLGEANLQALIDMGMDHIDFTTNPKIDKILFRRSFEELGSDAIMHLHVYSAVPRFAYMMGIPLVVWSENSATQYCAPDHELAGSDISEMWVRRLGSTQNRLIQDYVAGELTERDLAQYWYPSDEQMAVSGIRQIFMGYYFRWNGDRHAKIARSFGFHDARNLDEQIVGYSPSNDLDDLMVGPHHDMKWPKFGFSRSMDNLSALVRSGKISRAFALSVLRTRPNDVNPKSIQALCDFVERPLSWYYDIQDKFRNHDIWEQRSDGTWHIPNFITDIDWHGVGQRESR